MITGYQRSGTNALFDSFKTEAVDAYNESDDSLVFYNWALRPEKQTRYLLRSTHKPVILKPISETYLRSMDELFDEYADYDVRAIYIFRDPVNVYYSNLKHDPVTYEPDAIDFYIEKWNRRNQLGIAVRPDVMARVKYVNYEELIKNERLFEQIKSFLEIPGNKRVDRDSSAGYKNLDPAVVAKIQAGTKPVVDKLNQLAANSFKN